MARFEGVLFTSTHSRHEVMQTHGNDTEVIARLSCAEGTIEVALSRSAHGLTQMIIYTTPDRQPLPTDQIGGDNTDHCCHEILRIPVAELVNKSMADLITHYAKKALEKQCAT